MKDIIGNIWVKRCVSIFCAAYAAVIGMFTYATFLYDLVFVRANLGTFLIVYSVASIVFLLLMIYSREMFMTRLISVLLLPVVFGLLLFNIANANWILIVPPFIVALVMFFAAGTAETVKQLNDLGIHAVYSESKGTAHEWLTWRRGLNEFIPHLFK